MLPDKERGGGWRGAGGDVLRVHDAALDLLQNNTNRGREKVRLDKVKWIEEREGGLGLTGGAGINRKYLQVCGTPSSNSASARRGS
jgi:hypothetical protein